MANAHAQQFQKIRGCRLVAGVDIDVERAREFCETYSIPQAYGSVQELLKGCDFDAASVVTPDALHVPCALPLVRAGKHVLCEKPIAPTAREGARLVTAARKAGVVNMINFSYRDNPVLHRARRLVMDGRLGHIRHFEAHYLQTWLTSPIWGDWRTNPAWLWRLSTRHGSKGALGDIGVHIMDLVTFVAAEKVKRLNASLKTFPKADGNCVGEYTLDANDSAYARIELEGGGEGTVAVTRWATGQPNSLALALYGTSGALRIDLDRSGRELELCVGRDVARATWKTVKCPSTPNMYRRFVTAIRTGKNDLSDFQRGWEVQKILDACFLSSEKGTSVSVR